MKLLVTAFAMASMSSAFAADLPLAKGSVEMFNAPASFLIVIDGDAAKRLYRTLDVAPSWIKGLDNEGWLNKNGKGIVCGQSLKSKKYYCSFNVNEQGVEQ